MISVTEAHRRFGDLARIRNGITTWISVSVAGGSWEPVLNASLGLIGYQFVPGP